MRDAPVPDITPPTRGEALVPALPKHPQPRKGRFGTMMLGLSTGLGLGLVGGLNLHRLVELDHTAEWVQQTQTFLQSGFDAARQELASRINGLMSRPGSVAEV